MTSPVLMKPPPPTKKSPSLYGREKELFLELSLKFCCHLEIEIILLQTNYQHITLKFVGPKIGGRKKSVSSYFMTKKKDL